MDINLEKDIEFKLKKLEDARQKRDKMPVSYQRDKIDLEIAGAENFFIDWLSQKMIGSKKRYD